MFLSGVFGAFSKGFLKLFFFFLAFSVCVCVFLGGGVLRFFSFSRVFLVFFVFF